MLKTEIQAREAFEDILNDSYEWPEIAGITCAPSDILRNCDPIAYREAFNDWLDQEIQEGNVIDEGTGEVWTAGV